MRSRRPGPDDANEYYFTYIDKAPDGDILEQLASQMVDTRAMLDSLTEEQAGYRYEPGKWSVKEVLGHVADAERVFAYRALSFSRGDAGPIPGMDQNEWSAGAGHDALSLGEVVADLVAVRASTVALFKNLSEEQWHRRGNASGFDFQAGAIAWIIAGHELHHRGVLVERYGLEG